MRVLGVGVTLTAAAKIVILEPEWMAVDFKQGVKRINQVFQHSAAQAFGLKTNDTRLALFLIKEFPKFGVRSKRADCSPTERMTRVIHKILP